MELSPGQRGVVHNLAGWALAKELDHVRETIKLHVDAPMLEQLLAEAPEAGVETALVQARDRHAQLKIVSPRVANFFVVVEHVLSRALSLEAAAEAREQFMSNAYALLQSSEVVRNAWAELIEPTGRDLLQSTSLLQRVLERYFHNRGKYATKHVLDASHKHRKQELAVRQERKAARCKPKKSRGDGAAPAGKVTSTPKDMLEGQLDAAALHDFLRGVVALDAEWLKKPLVPKLKALLTAYGKPIPKGPKPELVTALTAAIRESAQFAAPDPALMKVAAPAPAAPAAPAPAAPAAAP